MQIALVGYGKMGKAVERIAEEREYTINAIFALPHASSKDKAASLAKVAHADIIIDFSTPQAFLDNMSELCALKKPIVVGTTGWYDHLDKLRSLVTKHEIPLIYSPNFSIGIHLFLQIVSHASKLIDRFDAYDVSGLEMHHNQKVDSPSGTAQAMAKAILAHSMKKSAVRYDCVEGPIAPHELHIASLRCGSIPGVHQALFDSLSDTITITHEARDRDGFARGAVTAAEWLYHQDPGLYTMQEMLISHPSGGFR
jgi:4-hydroxy-tetrahydrodipicolinate reductase